MGLVKRADGHTQQEGSGLKVLTQKVADPSLQDPDSRVGGNGLVRRKDFELSLEGSGDNEAVKRVSV